MEEIDRMIANAYPQAHGTKFCVCYLLISSCRHGACLHNAMDLIVRENSTWETNISKALQDRRMGSHPFISKAWCSPSPKILQRNHMIGRRTLN